MSLKRKIILAVTASFLLSLGGLQYYGETLTNKYVQEIQNHKLESHSRDILDIIYNNRFGVFKIFMWSVPASELARNDAFFARQNSDIPKALNIFRRLGQIAKNKKQGHTKKVALAHFDTAQTLFRAKDYRNSVANYELCLKKMPKNVECRRELEILYTFMVQNSMKGEGNNLINKDGADDGDMQSMGKEGQGRSGPKGMEGI